MPLFDYEVVDRTGATTRGRIEAPEQDDAVARFRERGQFVLSLREARTAEVDREAAVRRYLGAFGKLFGGVKLSVLVLFTGQLAAMLGAGLHLIRVLSAIAADSTDKRFRRVLEDVRSAIIGGSTLADALARHPNVFNTLYVAIVRAGELSGSLPLVLDMLTVYLEKIATLRRKVVGAMTYPAVILSVALLIVFVIVLNIVPIFEGVYARAGAKLPPPTQFLLAVSRTLREYTLLVVIGVLVFAVLLYLLVQTQTGRRLFDGFKLRMPLFGPLIRKAIMARVCRTLSVLLQSGIPLIEAMETSAKVANNKVVEGAMMGATQRVRDGVTIADALRAAGQFPSMVTQIVSSGEESGTLPQMLAKGALYYEEQVDNTVATLATLIEPLMIVVMGAVVGGVIFALYLPVFSLGQAVRGGFK